MKSVIAVAGRDTDAKERVILTDATGRPQVSIAEFVAGAGTVTVTGGGTRKAQVITTPDPAAEYAAGDAIGAVFEIANITPAAGRPVMLTGAHVLYGAASPPAGLTTLRLHMFRTTKTLADNGAVSGIVAAALAAADDYLGYVNFDTAMAAVSGLAMTSKVDLGMQITPATTSIWCSLETDGTFTPASASTKVLVALEVAYL